MEAKAEELISQGRSKGIDGARRRTNFERGMAGIYVIWLREFKRFWRDTARRIGAIAQPLLYLFLLGTGMQSAFKVFGGGTTKYVIFMFPGILGMTVLFTAVFSAISIVWDREFGFLKEVLVSPIPRSSVALGKIVGGATTAVIQGMIFLILAFFPMFFGFSLSTLYKVLILIPIILLLALGLTSLGVAIAARMHSFEGFPIVMNFILMPLFFLSGAFFPLQGLPSWMEVLTKIDPLTYGVDALRGIALRGVTITTGVSPQITEFINDIKSYVPQEILMKHATSFQNMMPQLQIQRYPLWLDLLVITGFGVFLVFVAIWQFGRQE
jgi:ABC-2 type transport system permease protein